jgi:hypothetical protein
MDIYLDQWFGLAASDTGLGYAEAVDLDQADGNRLTVGQLAEQPVDADFRAHHIFMAANAMVILQFVGGVAVSLAQTVDPAIARDGSEPRQEGSGGVIARALAVERNQRVLHQIIDRIGGNLLRKKPCQPAPGLFEQHRISLLVAALRARHQVTQGFLARDHARRSNEGAGTGAKFIDAFYSLHYAVQLQGAQ